MRARVNGTWVELEGEATLGRLVERLGLDLEGAALVINGEVVPRDRATECPLRDGDEVEVVRLVGGG